MAIDGQVAEDESAQLCSPDQHLLARSGLLAGGLGTWTMGRATRLVGSWLLLREEGDLPRAIDDQLGPALPGEFVVSPVPVRSVVLVAFATSLIYELRLMNTLACRSCDI